MTSDDSVAPLIKAGPLGDRYPVEDAFFYNLENFLYFWCR